MALKRTENWDTKDLHDFLCAHAKDAFVWGVWDCCLFPANAIESFTGVDIAADFRGKYHDRENAFAAIGTVANGKTVADAAAYCASKAGMTEYPKPLFASRGDLVVCKVASDDGTEVAGIVGLHGQVLAVSEKGLLRLPISSVTRAWKV